MPFGQIDLHLWATAVKRPALAGSPPRPREPFGVAELFRLCREEATHKMWESYHRGQSQLLVTHRERAELYIDQFADLGITVAIEPVGA